jgi:hypothetical protein
MENDFGGLRSMRYNTTISYNIQTRPWMTASPLQTTPTPAPTIRTIVQRDENASPTAGEVSRRRGERYEW